MTGQFAAPQTITDPELAFGGDMKKLLPPMSEIPDEFKTGRGPYVKFQRDWFYKGLSKEQIPAAKPGIDQENALRHLAAIQSSFAPKHEHKEAGVAYLASLWLEEPK